MLLYRIEFSVPGLWDAVFPRKRVGHASSEGCRKESSISPWIFSWPNILHFIGVALSESSQRMPGRKTSARVVESLLLCIMMLWFGLNVAAFGLKDIFCCLGGLERSVFILSLYNIVRKVAKSLEVIYNIQLRLHYSYLLWWERILTFAFHSYQLWESNVIEEITGKLVVWKESPPYLGDVVNGSEVSGWEDLVRHGRVAMEAASRSPGEGGTIFENKSQVISTKWRRMIWCWKFICLVELCISVWVRMWQNS